VRRVPVVVALPPLTSAWLELPHISALLSSFKPDAARLVSAVQPAGMVLVSWLAARLSSVREVRRDQASGSTPLRRLPACRRSTLRAVSVDQAAGRVPVRLLPLRSMKDREYTWPSSAGREPAKARPSSSRRVGTPAVHTTPPHTGLTQGSTEAEAQPVRPADVQLAGVTAARRAYSRFPEVGGGGGGEGHGVPTVVLVATTVAWALRLAGTVPHMSELLLSTRRVKPAMPPGGDHAAGTVEDSWFRLTSRRFSPDSVDHAAGRAPVSALLASVIHVRPVSSEYSGGRLPVKPEPVMFRLVSVVT